MIVPLIKGLALTIKTVPEPQYVRHNAVPRRDGRARKQDFAGSPELQIGKTAEKSVLRAGCVQKVCPSQCIAVEGADDETQQKIPKSLRIGCLPMYFCGFCGRSVSTGGYNP